jgi:hypothetical protein
MLLSPPYLCVACVRYEPHWYWWECLEMVRRLVLVGVMVLVSRGSVSQLVIATAVCAVYLLLQMQVAPFESLADDFLATGCSFALLIFFACCVMFKIATLTEVSDLRERMSIEQRSDVRIHPSIDTSRTALGSSRTARGTSPTALGTSRTAPRAV